MATDLERLLSGEVDNTEEDLVASPAVQSDLEKLLMGDIDPATDTVPNVGMTDFTPEPEPAPERRESLQAKDILPIAKEGMKDVVRNTATGITSQLELTAYWRDWDEMENKEREIPFSSFTSVDQSRFIRELETRGIDPSKLSKEEFAKERVAFQRSSSEKYQKGLQDTRAYVNEKFESDPEYLVSTGWIEDFIRMGPQIGSQVLTSLATGGAGSVALMFAQISGAKTDALVKEGIPFERAATAGLYDAILQSPLEQIGINKLTKLFGAKTAIASKLKKAVEVMGTEFLTEYAQAYPDAYTEIWGKNPDMSMVEKNDRFLDTIISGEFQGQAIKEGSIAAVWSGVIGGPSIARAPAEGQTTDDSGQRNEEIETGKPGVTLVVKDERNEADVRLEAESVPSVETLLGVEQDPSTPTPDGVSVSNDTNVTDEQRTNQHQSNDTIKQVLGELAGEKAMDKHRLDIDVSKAKLDSFVGFYNDMVTDGDAQGGLQMAQMMEQETNNIIGNYEKLLGAANARAKNKNMLPDPAMIESVQAEVARLQKQSSDRVKAQTTLVRAEEQAARQQYIERMNTVDGLQTELIGATNVATRDNQPKMAKLYNSVISEMRFRQASGNLDYFSKTPMKKLVDLEVQATLIAEQNKTNPNVDANVIERDNAINRWLKQQQADRIEFDQVQLVGDRAIMQDKVDQAMAAETVEKTQAAEAKPAVKAVERRRKNEATGRKIQERKRIQERQKKTTEAKRVVEDQRAEVRKPIAGPTRAEELKTAKEDKAKRVSEIEKQVQRVEGLERPKAPIAEGKATVKDLKKDTTNFAIVTSDNPQASKTTTPAQNAKARSKFLRKLVKLGISFTKGKSKFKGSDEVPVVIHNISRANAKKLSDELDQSSFIIAEGKKLHFIEGGDVNTVNRSDLKKAPDATDNFTVINGEKFKIPFFSEASTLNTEMMQIDPEVAPDAKRLFRAAAIRFKGTLYEGNSHIGIIMDNNKLSKAIDDAYIKDIDDNLDDGFVTHDGEFINRQKATEMVGKKDGEDLYSEDFLNQTLAQRADNTGMTVVDFDTMPLDQKMGTLEIMEDMVNRMKTGKFSFLFNKTKKGDTKTLFVTGPGQYGKLQEVVKTFPNLKARDNAINRFELLRGVYFPGQNTTIINIPTMAKNAKSMDKAFETMVHEHVHAAHKLAFDKMSKEEKEAFGVELKMLWASIDPNFIRQQRDDKSVNVTVRAGINQITSDINELVSYSMAHPEFAAWLDSIPASPRFRAMSSKIKTVWDALVNLIVKKSLKAVTKLDEVTDVLNKHLKLSEVRFSTEPTAVRPVRTGNALAAYYANDKGLWNKIKSVVPGLKPRDMAKLSRQNQKKIEKELRKAGIDSDRFRYSLDVAESKVVAATPSHQQALAAYYRGKPSLLKKVLKKLGIGERDILLKTSDGRTLRFSKDMDLADTSFNFGANIDRFQVKEWTNDLDSQAPGGLDTTVVADRDGMSKVLGFKVPENAVGMWTDDGKLVINAERIDTKEKLVKVWMHEQVGHHGLREVFGKNTALFNRFVDQSYTLFSIKEQDNVVEQAKNLGIFVGLDSAGKPVMKFKLAEKRLIAEEMLARKAETLKPVTKTGILKRFKAFLAKWLPARFMDVKAADILNTNDMWQVISSAREVVFTGSSKFSTLLDKAVTNRRPRNKFKPWKNLPDFVASDKQYLDMAAESVKAAPHLKEWYAQHQDEIRSNLGKDADLFNVLLAITSPQADVEINVQYAVNTYAYMLGLRDMPGGRYPNVVKKRIDEHWTSPDAMLANLESPNFKVTEFARALLGDEFATVGDLWMYRLFYGDPATTVNKDAETYSKAQIVGLRQKLFSLASQMTERTGETWTPREMQAALWININAKQTGKDISKVSSYHSGLNRPTEMYGGKTPLEYLNSVVPNLSEGPLSDVIGISNIPLAPISPLAKWTAFNLGKEDKVNHKVSDSEQIVPAGKHGMTNFHISRMINAITKGGREVTAPDQDMATWYQKTFGFETVDDSLHMRLSDRALELFSDNKGNIKSNKVRDNLGGFSGNYTRAVRFSKDAEGNLHDMAAEDSVQNDTEFLATNEDKLSHINKIHEWRDQSKLNVDRMTNQLEQEFLEKFGGRQAVISRATGVASGRLLHTAESELMAMAMNLYVDSGTGANLDKVLAFRKKLLSKQNQTLADVEKLKVIDRMLSMSDEARGWADSNIRPHYEQFFKFAQEKGILDSHVDNYVKRSWIMPKDLETAGVSWNGTGTTGFKLTPSSGKPRSFDSVVDGWDAGMELRTNGIIGNLNDYANELGYTYANRRFVEYMKSLVNETGDGIIIERSSGVKPPPNYTLLKDRGFARPGQVAYARSDIGEMINKLGDRATHKFWDIPVVKFLRQMNSTIKSTLLSVSMFHHLAGLRSYVFGVTGTGWQRLRPIKAYREGLKKIDEQTGFDSPNYQHLGPIVDLLVREGLTFGRTQDWEGDTTMAKSHLEEFLRKQQTGIGAGRALQGWQGLRRWKRQWTNGLFNQLFAGLKAQSGAVELTHRINKFEKKYGRGMTDAEIKLQATQVARLINADFGGLHLSRRGRNPDFQRLLQSLMLAPDWTESNWRTLTGMIPGLNKQVNKMIGDNPAPAGMDKTYRHFWTGIALRGAFTVVAAQFAVLALFGDDDDKEEYYKQVVGGLTDREEFAKGRWATIDITPMLKTVGIDTPEGKRVDFNMVGHFKDAFKALAPTQLIKHKQSPAFKVLESSLSATDWKGDRFKTLKELWDDPRGLTADKYKDSRDPEGFLEWTGAIEQLFASTVYNLAGAVPIPLTEVLATAAGETSLVSGAGRFVGVDVRDVRHRDPAEQFYWKKSQEIKRLERALDEAKLVRDNRMITAARQDIKRYDGFNQTKSRLGFARARLSPINKKIRALESTMEQRSLMEAELAKLRKLKQRKADIYKKFVDVIGR